MRAEFRTRLFRFVDDVMFEIDETKTTSRIRSASRVGGTTSESIASGWRRFAQPSPSGSAECPRVNFLSMNSHRLALLLCLADPMPSRGEPRATHTRGAEGGAPLRRHVRTRRQQRRRRRRGNAHQGGRRPHPRRAPRSSTSATRRCCPASSTPTSTSPTRSADDCYRDFFDGFMRQPAEQAHPAPPTYARKHARGRLHHRARRRRERLRRRRPAQRHQRRRRRRPAHARRRPRHRRDAAATATTIAIPPTTRFATSPARSTASATAPTQCRAAVRYQIKYGADVIKFMPSGGVLSLADPVDAPQLTQDEMNAIVDEAHRLGPQGRRALPRRRRRRRWPSRAGVDSIEHGSFLKPDTLRHDEATEASTSCRRCWPASAIGGRNVDTFPPAIAAKAARRDRRAHRDVPQRARSSA